MYTPRTYFVSHLCWMLGLAESSRRVYSECYLRSLPSILENFVMSSENHSRIGRIRFSAMYKQMELILTCTNQPEMFYCNFVFGFQGRLLNKNEFGINPSSTHDEGKLMSKNILQNVNILETFLVEKESISHISA